MPPGAVEESIEPRRLAVGASAEIPAQSQQVITKGGAEMGVILILIAVLLLVFLVPAIFQWLWNITMPQVFGLRPVSYWIAFRLLIIADILFSTSYVRFH
jgi:hypothetical protein